MSMVEDIGPLLSKKGNNERIYNCISVFITS